MEIPWNRTNSPHTLLTLKIEFKQKDNILYTFSNNVFLENISEIVILLHNLFVKNHIEMDFWPSQDLRFMVDIEMEGFSPINRDYLGLFRKLLKLQITRSIK